VGVPGFSRFFSGADGLRVRMCPYVCPVCQGARAESDDEDGGQKVSRKKGLTALFGDDDDGGGEGAAAAAASGRKIYDDVDSDDSMKDFIEDDGDEQPGEMVFVCMQYIYIYI
jgi:hypothetical protein